VTGNPQLVAKETRIAGLWHVCVKQAVDDRGVVREFFRRSAFGEAGVPVGEGWPQINVTSSKRGVLRGIHAEAMDKYVMLGAGEAYAAVVDLRPDSPTAGEAEGFELAPGDGLFVSAGLGNSFQTTSAESTYVYWFSDEWRPGMPGFGADPLDPALAAHGITWPIPVDRGDRGSISEKDATAPTIADCIAAQRR
jgi:dTDP-4-dehydrorhamnose 3,5-epimerase